jgi:hypothetical protein
VPVLMQEAQESRGVAARQAESLAPAR